MLNKDEEKVLGSFDKAEDSKVLDKEDEAVLGSFDKAEMGGADTYQLDFYGIQKGEGAEEKTPEQVEQEKEAAEAEAGPSDDMEKMLSKMVSDGLSKMMEGEDSPMAKMMQKMMEGEDSPMAKMMRKMMGEMGKSLPVEDTSDLVKSEPVVVESVEAERGRDALLGWLSK